MTATTSQHSRTPSSTQDTGTAHSNPRGICRAARDIKLENVLLDAEGNPKLSDFGLGALPHSERDDGLLRTSCGTPNYVSPEVLARRGYDGFLADVWSLGACNAARCCTGTATPQADL